MGHFTDEEVGTGNVNLLKTSQQEDSDIFLACSLLFLVFCWLLEKKILVLAEPSGWWPPLLRWSGPQFAAVHTVCPPVLGWDEAWD